MGRVYLVGAGPGDPGLLTLRAAELLRKADFIVHDAQVPERVLGLLRPDAETVCVGPDCATQEEVNAVLARAAGTMEIVVRLKMGDPFVFGRGGEEGLFLREAGIELEVVPGVSAGIAAPAYAGIPVIHADLASSVRLVGAHSAQATSEMADTERETLVAFMPLGRLAAFTDSLVARGWSAETPAAMIESGTCPRQRTVTAPLAEIAACVQEAGIAGPAILVVGSVVSLRERLHWFEARPLFGRRILVTRARAQAPDLADALEALGAEPVLFPTIRIAPPADPLPLLQAAREIAFYDWVIFTSVNGVDRFWAALEEVGQDARALGGVQVACIGPATAAACELRGVRPELVPSKYIAEAVEQALADATELRGVRILLPRAAGAREVLPDGLAARGAEVEEVEAYRAVPDTDGGAALLRRLKDGEIDAITFTSSSTVRNFVDAVGSDVGSAVVCAIGPVTGQTALELGLPVHVEAAEHTIPGLVRSLADWFRGK